MRLLRLTLTVAAAVFLVAMAENTTASAACIRKCVSITSSGFCTKYGSCEPVVESVLSAAKTVRSAKNCHRYLALRCDDGSCETVCNRPKK